jgi:hypothetical protein
VGVRWGYKIPTTVVASLIPSTQLLTLPAAVCSPHSSSLSSPPSLLALSPSLSSPSPHPMLTAICGDYIIQSGEDCDGGACCNATCYFTTNGTICRNSNGTCDTPEYCSGASSACPSDQYPCFNFKT